MASTSSDHPPSDNEVEKLRQKAAEAALKDPQVVEEGFETSKVLIF